MYKTLYILPAYYIYMQWPMHNLIKHYLISIPRRIDLRSFWNKIFFLHLTTVEKVERTNLKIFFNVVDILLLVLYFINYVSHILSGTYLKMSNNHSTKLHRLHHHLTIAFILLKNRRGVQHNISDYFIIVLTSPFKIFIRILTCQNVFTIC